MRQNHPNMICSIRKTTHLVGSVGISGNAGRPECGQPVSRSRHRSGLVSTRHEKALDFFPPKTGDYLGDSPPFGWFQTTFPIQIHAFFSHYQTRSNGFIQQKWGMTHKMAIENCDVQSWKLGSVEQPSSLIFRQNQLLLLSSYRKLDPQSYFDKPPQTHVPFIVLGTFMSVLVDLGKSLPRGP